MTFELFLLILTVLYIVQTVYLMVGLGRSRDRKGSATPTVSVVVAARNEESHLPACLASFARQTYSNDRFEVILVNDRSSDGTEAICREYVAAHPNAKTILAEKDEALRGKPNALAQGIDRATGEVILITDADCVVPPTWVEHTARRYDADVGLVGGMTLQNAETLFGAIQSLDWAYILGVAASSAGWGNPLGSIGNNLSFRRTAYDAVGGYRKLPFSVTEDYTLVQAIVNTGRWEYLYPMDPLLLVESQPCNDGPTLLGQKHRWGKGGLKMKLTGFLLMTIAFLMNISPFIVLYWGKAVLAATCLMIKLTCDYFFVHRVLARLGKTEQLKWYYPFAAYFLAYTTFLPFLVLLGGPVRWKGRTYP